MVTHNDIPAVLEQMQKDLERILRMLSHSDENSKDSQDRLMTRSEVCSWLKIGKSTLHNWVLARRIKKYCLGGRVYFKYFEIMEILKKHSF